MVPRMRIEIDMGSTATPGAVIGPALLDLEELLATRLLVQGNSGSGKSHLLRRLLEQSAPHVQQVVVDPEGDFASLADRFGHVVIDADRSVVELETIAARVRQHRISAVLTLESLDPEMQMRAAAIFLNALFDADRDHWFPVLVVVDEAQLFAPAVSGDVSEEVRKLSLGAMTNLMCRGRKRGLAGIIATQRLAKLAKNVAAEATNFLMGRTFLDIDMARAADLLGLERRQAEMFRELQRGQFVALGPALSRRPLPIRVGGVETAPRIGIPTLMPLPGQANGEARDLILAPVRVGPARPPAERRPATAPPSTNQILEEIVPTARRPLRRTTRPRWRPSSGSGPCAPSRATSWRIRRRRSARNPCSTATSRSAAASASSGVARCLWRSSSFIWLRPGPGSTRGRRMAAIGTGLSRWPASSRTTFRPLILSLRLRP